MPAFKSKDELVQVLSALWDEIFNTPTITEKISAEKLIVKFRFTDFGADLYIDNKRDALRGRPSDALRGRPSVFKFQLIQ